MLLTLSFSFVLFLFGVVATCSSFLILDGEAVLLMQFGVLVEDVGVAGSPLSVRLFRIGVRMLEKEFFRSRRVILCLLLFIMI